jgi:hypothetical protein
MKGSIGTAGMLAVVMTFAAAANVAAQACFGYPTGPGRFGVALDGAFHPDARGWGGSVHGNLAGPVSFDGGYQYVDLKDTDTNGNRVAGRVAVELPVDGVSVCPYAGGARLWASETQGITSGTVSANVFPVGLGIGRTFAAGGGHITLFAQPQLAHVRSKLRVSIGEATLEFSENETEFGGTAGVRIGAGAFYIGGTVGMLSFDQDDPTIGVTLGFLLRARR